MKKFNLFNEITISNKNDLLKAINSSRVYGITTKGAIKYAPFDAKDILIYEGKHTPKPTNALMPQNSPTLADIFGKKYQIVDDEDRVLIKSFSNWQELIGVNTLRASYDDTTGDGVDKFADEALEDIGWQATEFDITYRELVEVLEEKCDGTLLCIEQKDPYQFSGLGFLDDDKQAYDILFEYCRKKIITLLDKNERFSRDNLSDDEEEAIEYFKCQ